MKLKLKSIALLIVCSIFLFSCNKNGDVVDASKITKLSNFTDSVSYTIGCDIGQNYLKQLISDSVMVNLDYVYKGMTDGLADSSKLPLLTKEEMRAVMQNLQAIMQSKQEAKQKEQKEKYEARQKTAKADGEKFLAENKTKAGVTSDPSGIQYRVITKGTGSIPKESDVVKFHIVGKFIDGEEFQSTHNMPEALQAPIAQLMPGMKLALSKMPIGSKWEVVVPPALAYGERDTGVIPPNSVIIFEIELLDIINSESTPQK